MTRLDRKLRFGMIGGGPGAFIGAVHRIAAQIDGEAELVAGAFSSDAARSRLTGDLLRLDPGRIYDSYVQMIEAEGRRPRTERLDFISIVTPNHEHFRPAQLSLDAGFNVVCDKPLTLNVADAEALESLVAKTKKIFVLTHHYASNAMVRQARALVRNGHLGTLRKVVVEYTQGWLSTPLEASGHAGATWRTDPARSGVAGCLGDIGTHAHHLACYITGLRLHSLCADFTTFVPGRRLEDDASILLRFHGGAKGVLHCSQVFVGDENNLNIRITGDRASLEWHQEHPNELIVKYADRPVESWRRGNVYNAPEAISFTRVPAGHPEGYLEAFSNLYREAFRAIRAELLGEPPPEECDFPSVHDGTDGMRFIAAAVESSRSGAKWVRL